VILQVTWYLDIDGSIGLFQQGSLRRQQQNSHNIVLRGFTPPGSINMNTSTNGTHLKPDKTSVEIAWLMSFPNSVSDLMVFSSVADE